MGKKKDRIPSILGFAWGQSLKGHSHLYMKGLSYLSLRIQKMDHKTQVLRILRCPMFSQGSLTNVIFRDTHFYRNKEKSGIKEVHWVKTQMSSHLQFRCHHDQDLKHDLVVLVRGERGKW